jgi:TM2 domain-containing membrane protein YozV
VHAKAIACTQCGYNPLDGNKFCQGCGGETSERQVMCTACGVRLSEVGQRPANPQGQPSTSTPGKRYCRHCASEVHLDAVACLSCGFPPNRSENYCQACGKATQPGQMICTGCGCQLRKAVGGQRVAYQGRTVSTSSPKSKLTAGLLAIFLGFLGVHKFYLGYSMSGAIILLIGTVGAVVTCGWAGWIMWALTIIEGILYLTKSDEEFTETYVDNKKEWF